MYNGYKSFSQAKKILILHFLILIFFQALHPFLRTNNESISEQIPREGQITENYLAGSSEYFAFSTDKLSTKTNINEFQKNLTEKNYYLCLLKDEWTSFKYLISSFKSLPTGRINPRIIFTSNQLRSPPALLI